MDFAVNHGDGSLYGDTSPTADRMGSRPDACGKMGPKGHEGHTEKQTRNPAFKGRISDLVAESGVEETVDAVGGGD